MKKKIFKQRDPQISNDINNDPVVESTGLSQFQDIPEINLSDLSHQSKEAPAPLVPDPKNSNQDKKER